MPKILLKFNMAVIKEIPMQDFVSTLTIGRKEDNEIVIDNPAVSGHHARIVKQANKYFIEDLNSTNGTFIGDKKILKAELQHNMQFEIAKYSLVFINESQEAVPANMPAQPMSSDQTVVIDPAKQKEMLEKMAAAKEQLAKQVEKYGFIRVTDGAIDNTEFELTSLNTYIGNGEAALIKIKPSSGIFGTKKITGNVAVINRRPEGYYVLKSLQEGMCKIDGKTVKNEIIELKEGNLIEVEKTKMIFFIKEK